MQRHTHRSQQGHTRVKAERHFGHSCGMPHPIMHLTRVCLVKYGHLCPDSFLRKIRTHREAPGSMHLAWRGPRPNSGRAIKYKVRNNETAGVRTRVRDVIDARAVFTRAQRVPSGCRKPVSALQTRSCPHASLQPHLGGGASPPDSKPV